VRGGGHRTPLRPSSMSSPDPDAIGGAIAVLARRPRMRAALAKGGRASVRERTWDRSLAALADGWDRTLAATAEGLRAA